MKKRKGVLFFLLVTIVLFTVGGSVAASPAQQVFPQGNTNQEWSDQDYLLPLPQIQPEDLTVMGLPSDLSPRQAREAAEAWGRQNVERYRLFLDGLMYEGRISGYEVRLDLNAILLRGVVDPIGLTGLPDNPEDISILPARQTDFCSGNLGQDVRLRVLALDQFGAEPEEPGSQQGDSEAQAIVSAPSINILSDVLNGQASSVYGKAAKNALVTLRVYRSGREVGLAKGHSDQRGFYQFAVTQFCEWHTYDPRLLVGDQVEVSAAGKSSNMVYDDLRGWADPQADTIAGHTASYRKVQIQLYHTVNNCSIKRYTKTLLPSALGDFSYAFNGKPDFNGLAEASIYAWDIYNNAVRVDIQAYHLEYDLQNNQVRGVTLPGQANVELDVIHTDTEEIYPVGLGADGSFSVSLSIPALEGDTLVLSGDEVDQYMDIASFEPVVNAAVNQATGITWPGEIIQARFVSQFFNSCASRQVCRTTRARPDGSFILKSGYNLRAGDEVQFIIIDEQGNWQFFDRHAPFLETRRFRDSNSVSVSGYWPTLKAHLTASLLSSDGSLVKDSQSQDSAWESFAFTLTSDQIAIGDLIEVSDGTTAQRMTLYDLYASLDSATRRLSGSAGPGSLLVRYTDVRPGKTMWRVNGCLVKGISTQQFGFSLPRVTIGPGDLAYLYHLTPQGYLTSGYAHAFTVQIERYNRNQVDYSTVKVYTLQPGQLVTVALKTGNTLLESVNATSNIVDSLAVISFQNQFLPGQIVEVSTSTNSAVFTIPTINYNENSSSNEISGVTLPNTPLWVYLLRYSAKGSVLDYVGRLMKAGQDGTFVTNFNNILFPINSQCYPLTAQVGSLCVEPAFLLYLLPSGHTFYHNQPVNVSYQEDSYEDDDTYDRRVLYIGPSHHTLTANDEDWISFSVSANQVGRPFIFYTYNVDPSITTEITLYTNKGKKVLATSTTFQRVAYLEYTFSAANDYSLKIAGNTGINDSCVPGYDFLMIDP